MVAPINTQIKKLKNFLTLKNIKILKYKITVDLELRIFFASGDISSQFTTKIFGLTQKRIKHLAEMTS